VVQVMSENVLTPSALSHNAATSACEKGLQWEAAIRVLQGMSERVLTPNAVSHNATTSASEKGL